MGSSWIWYLPNWMPGWVAPAHVYACVRRNRIEQMSGRRGQTPSLTLSFWVNPIQCVVFGSTPQNWMTWDNSYLFGEWGIYHFIHLWNIDKNTHPAYDPGLLWEWNEEICITAFCRKDSITCKYSGLLWRVYQQQTISLCWCWIRQRAFW